MPPATSLWDGNNDKEETGGTEKSVKPEDGGGADGGAEHEESLGHQES